MTDYIDLKKRKNKKSVKINISQKRKNELLLRNIKDYQIN